MKKMLVVLMLVVFATYSFSEVEARSGIFKLGMAFGTMDTDTDRGDEDLDLERTLALEYVFRMTNRMDYGLGAAFEEHEIKNLEPRIGLGDIESYPVYGIMRYRFKPMGAFTPYVYGNLGYAFIDKQRGIFAGDDGPYFGIGVGSEFADNFGVELGWSRTYIDGSIGGKSVDPVSDLIKFNLVLKLDH